MNIEHLHRCQTQMHGQLNRRWFTKSNVFDMHFQFKKKKKNKRFWMQSGVIVHHSIQSFDSLGISADYNKCQEKNAEMLVR